MRWLKYIVIGLTSLLIVSVTMVVTLALLLDQDQIRDALVYAVDQTTDHQLDINGPLELDISLSPSIRVSDIYFKTAAENIELSAAEIHLQVDLLSLRSKYMIVHEILVRDGIVNIRQTPDEGEEDDLPFEQSDIRVPFIEKLSIENIEINYWQPEETEPLHIKLDSLEKDDKADADTIVLKGAGTIDGTAFKLEGESGTVAALFTSDQPFPFKYHFDVMQAVIHTEGTITNLHETGDLDIGVQTEASDVQAILELLHIKAPDIGQLSATYRLAGTFDAPQMNDIDISVSKDKVNLQVTGTVGNILTAEDTRLDFSAAVSDKKLLDWVLPDESPAFNNIQTSGKFTVSDGALSLSELTLDATDRKGHKLTIQGSTRIVDAPLPLRDLNATVAVSLPDTGFIRQFTKTVPQIGPVVATARVSTAADALVVEDIKLTAGNEKTVKIEALGDIRHIAWDPTVDVSNMDLQVKLTGPSAKTIGNLLNSELPDVGPVKLKGQYSGSITSSSIKGLHLQIGAPEQLQIEASGDIKLGAFDSDELLAGLNLETTFEAPSTAALTALTGTEFPALGWLKGSATIQDTNGIPGITALDINVQKGDDLRITLNGVLADLEKMNGLNMKFDLFAADMNVIGQLFDQTLSKEGSIKSAGRIKGSLEQTRFTGRINLRNTTIEADLTGAFTGERPRLAGAITIPDMDVHDLGYYPDKQVETTSTSANDNYEWHAPEKKKAVITKPLFSKEPFDLSGLKAIDLDLEITVNKLSSNLASLDNIYSHIFLKNGKLELKPLNYTVDGDVISVEVMINSATNPPDVALHIIGDDIDMGLLLGDSATKTAPIRGIMTAAADISSRGRSSAELAANLDGHIYLVAENSKVRKGSLNLVNVDVLGFVISNLVSLNKDANIGCTIFSMRFNKGMGKTDLFLMDTPDSLIRVDADVNLVNETMDIAILSEYKIRLLKKKKPMKIYGSITNPTYEVVSLVDLTRETTRSALLAPLTITKGLLGNITELVVKPDEAGGSCDKFLE